MELEDFQGSRMHKWLKPRYRQSQVFYSGIANLAWQSRKRPYCTPILFLVIKHYAERFDLVEYINSQKLIGIEANRRLAPESLH